jgi:hypothetical protein
MLLPHPFLCCLCSNPTLFQRFQIQDCHHFQNIAVGPILSYSSECLVLSCCRTLDMSSEDIGALTYRKFDIEAWMFGLCCYGEVCSSRPKLCF